MRPVLSMPGSPYYKTVCKVTQWLSEVDECKINSSSKSISDKLHSIVLEEDEVLVNFDIVPKYSNFLVNEALSFCTEYMFLG